jgi:hypothetical protein
MEDDRLVPQIIFGQQHSEISEAEKTYLVRNLPDVA